MEIGDSFNRFIMVFGNGSDKTMFFVPKIKGIECTSMCDSHYCFRGVCGVLGKERRVEG